MGESCRFGKSELKVVKEQLATAEGLLSRYYCIPSHEWPRYPYEVKTLAELRGSEISPEAFALVAKYEYSKSQSGSSAGKELFGICLQDHNILTAAGRDAGRIDFKPLMLYILTHELVHIFRFANRFENYFAAAHQRSAEERRVHKITQDVLSLHQDLEVLPVLEAYHDFRI